jgi:uncharacterized protein (DUF2225 family)
MSVILFIEKEILCPACDISFKLKYPNPKLYAATSRDEDQRVTEYSWTAGIKTDLQPHYYTVLQCPNCLLADFHEKLEKPGLDKRLKEEYNKLLELPFEQKMILRKLRRLVPEGELTARSAAAIHLAAIFGTLLPGKESQIDHMKLGRLYLRLSWLYKEIDEMNGKAENGDETEGNGSVASTATATELSKTVEEMEEHIQGVMDALENARELGEKRTDELQLESGENPFNRYINAIDDNIERALQELGQLEAIVRQDRNKILTITGKSARTTKKTSDRKEGTNSEDNFEEVIASLAENWPHIPLNEESAVKLAVEAFDFSYKHEEECQDIQQSMVVGGLILHLLEKTGQPDLALAHGSILYKTAFRDKQAMQMTLNDAKRDNSLTEAEIKDMNRSIATISTTLSRAADSRKKILEQLYQRDKKKISDLLKTNPGANTQKQVQLLTEAGFAEDFVIWLRENNYLDNDTRKKKRFGR